MFTYPEISPDYRALGFWIKLQKEKSKKNVQPGIFKQAESYFVCVADDNRRADFLFYPRSAE